MYREILFRGKRVQDGQWVFGSYVKMDDDMNECFRSRPTKEIHQIIQYEAGDWNLGSWAFYDIVPETVGQFTGFYAKNKKPSLDSKIFEDDIFSSFNEDEEEVYYIVMWIVPRGAFYMVPIEHYKVIKNHNVSEEIKFSWLFDDALLYDFSADVLLTKVGNIHDNAELINN